MRICNGITNTLAYNTANKVLSETFSGGILNGLTVTNAFDSYLRRTAIGLNTQPSTLTQFGYDAASRLQGVTNGFYNVAYAYLANSPFVSQITFRTNSTTRMMTTKSYDYLNRLTAISAVPSGSGVLPVSFSCAYNSANQRIRSTLLDGSYWLYHYDSLGQVRSGKKYWSDGTPVAGQQFEYGFDDIGNRSNTKTGGDENGWNLRSANYAANSLNQYTNRDVPGYVDITGLSFATNSVTVNSQTAYRKNEYFRKELPVNNASASLWTNIVVEATGQTGVTGNVFVAKTPEPFAYDADGNLTSDGRWTNRWDGENRMIGMETLSSVPAGGKKALGFGYDARGRRQSLVVSNWSGSAWTNVTAQMRRFIYDDWNLLAALDGNNSLVQSFVWGLDLSGSAQGAGGVGGLVAVNDAANGGHFAALDGNGNVTALVKGSDGTVSANYEYGPFGEMVRATGPMAKVNPMRFSTKYQDNETDLVYYGYRFFNPSPGRWISRDPLGERQVAIDYAFCRNSTLNCVDSLGLEVWKCPGVTFLYGTTDLGPRPPERGRAGETIANWVVNFWAAPVCKEPGDAMVRSRGDANISYWWSTSPDHELHHVAIYRHHFFRTFEQIANFTGVCMCKPKAECYAELGRAIWKHEQLEAQYWQDFFDCTTYGNTFGACDRLEGEIIDADKAARDRDGIESKCKTTRCR